MPARAKSGSEYLFSVPGAGAFILLVWQARQAGKAGRVIGISRAD
jgi:hypothetical protein